MKDPESGDEDEPLTSGSGHRSQSKNKSFSRSFNTRRRVITIGGFGVIVLLVVFIISTKQNSDSKGTYRENLQAQNKCCLEV